MNQTANTKTLSEAAQVAKIIRTELKKNGVKAKVTSDNFSMGNSVSVELIDELPATYEKIKAFCADFEDGRFDGMTDCYEYKPNPKNLPRAKYVHVRNHFSAEMVQRMWSWMRKHYGSLGDYPESYSEARTAYLADWSEYADVAIWLELRNEKSRFWLAVKPRIIAEAA